MAQSITTFDDALKEDYKDLVEQLSNTTVLVAQLETNKDVADGRRAVFALHTSRNGGIGGAETGAALPTAGQQGYVNGMAPLRKRYASIQLERQLFKITDTSAAAFANAVTEEMERVRDDVRVDEARQAYGTSDGVVAATGASGPSTTVSLATTTSATQLRQLSDWAGPVGQGRLIDIGTVASPTSIASDRTLISVDETAKTIVISGAAVTVTTAERIFFANQGGASSNTGLQNDGQIELTGLQTMIDNDNIVHTIDPGTTALWKSFVSHNSGTNRAVTENLINNALFNVESRSGGAVNLLVSNFGVNAAIASEMRAMRRNNDTVALKGGYTGIAFSTPGQGRQGSETRTLTWDRDCPNNTLFGVTTKHIVNYEAAPWQWREETGSVWRQAYTGGAEIDQLTAGLARYHDFVIKRRNTSFVLRDLTEASG